LTLMPSLFMPLVVLLPPLLDATFELQWYLHGPVLILTLGFAWYTITSVFSQFQYRPIKLLASLIIVLFQLYHLLLLVSEHPVPERLEPSAVLVLQLYALVAILSVISLAFFTFQWRLIYGFNAVVVWILVN